MMYTTTSMIQNMGGFALAKATGMVTSANTSKHVKHYWGNCMTKKIYSISIDPRVWNLAKRRIDTSLSDFIQRQLEQACSLTDDVQLLEKEIHEKEKEIIARENELIAMREHLCDLKEQKNTTLQGDAEFDAAMETLQNVFTAHGYVGRNQIAAIADLHGLQPFVLENECSKNGIIMKEVFEPAIEKIRNPVTGKY